MMEMQGNATEIDERNLLQLDALLSHGYGLSPQLVMRSKGLSIEAKALYGYLSSFAGAGDTAFPSTSRILEELDISKNRFYKIRKTSTTSCLNSLSLRQRPSRCVTSVLSQVPSPSLTIRATSTSSLVSWISI